MQIDFVISLSLIVVVGTILGMAYVWRYVSRHIKEDAMKANKQ